MDFIRKKLNKSKKILVKNEVEVLILIGAFFIASATFKLSFIAFLYLIGAYFIGMAWFLLKYPKRR